MFIPATNFGEGVPELSIDRFFFYLLMVVFSIEISITKVIIKNLSKWFAVLCIFYLIVVASIKWSNYYSYNFETIQMLFEKAFVPFFIAFLAHYLFSAKHNIDLYIKNSYICAGIVSLISIFSMVFALASGNTAYRSELGGALDNPNLVAIFLVLTIPCILYGIENKIIPRVSGWVVTVSVIFGIICTVSRKGTVTMVLAFSLILLFRKQFKKLIVLGILCAAFIPIILGVATFSSRFSSEVLQEQFEGKAVMALAGLDMFKRSPLIGNGYKGYHRLFAEYFPASRFGRYDAHNIYITALANYGIIGFIPFIGIFLYPLFFSYKKLRGKNTSLNTQHLKQMAIICIASVVPFMISGWFAGGLFYTNVVMLVLYSQITFVFSAAAWKKQAPDPNRSDV